MRKIILLKIYLLFTFSLIESFLKNGYFIIFIYLLIALFLSIIILSVSYFLVIQIPEVEKLSTYECGFEPYGDSRNKFDVKFYLIAIFFIIFDIESMFLFPWALSLGQLDTLGFWAVIDFIIELGIGFVYIWYLGALKFE